MLQVPEIPHPPSSAVVDESSGRPLFTFSSETASLIKFLSVAAVVPGSCRDPSTSAGVRSMSSEKVENKNQPLSSHIEGENEPSNSCSNSDNKRASEYCYTSGQWTDAGHSHVEDDIESQSDIESSKTSPLEMHNINSPSHNTQDSNFQITPEVDSKVDNSDDSDSSSTIQPKKIKVDCSDNSAINLQGKHLYSAECSAHSQNKIVANKSSECHLNVNNNQRSVIDSISCHDCIQGRESSEVSKNLIFVTGEFAVALHQLGFKNVPSISESASRGRTLSDSSAGDDGYMVVNYSNNDIHIVQRQDRTDKPDSLIDLFGHVTGLCLSEDQR